MKLRLRTSCGEMIVKYRVAVSGALLPAVPRSSDTRNQHAAQSGPRLWEGMVVGHRPWPVLFQERLRRLPGLPCTALSHSPPGHALLPCRHQGVGNHVGPIQDVSQKQRNPSCIPCGPALCAALATFAPPRFVTYCPYQGRTSKMGSGGSTGAAVGAVGSWGWGQCTGGTGVKGAIGETIAVAVHSAQKVSRASTKMTE